MRTSIVVLVSLMASLVAVGCGPQQVARVDGVRDISLLSHLGGAIADDPEVAPGEVVRVIPAPAERYFPHVPEVVELPASTPYRDALTQRIYLYGYAIGVAATRNMQFT